jgi:hypothetical protein
VRFVVVIATLWYASGVAAAQNGSSNQALAPDSSSVAKRARPGKAHALSALPVVIPRTFAPPQEEFASFPDTSGGATMPAAPSACQIALAKIAEFKPLPILVGPGECGATDAVSMDAIVLPDQSRVTVMPAAIMRCPMAEQVAQWIREDVAPSMKRFGPPLRGLDNFDSYSCRGRNNIRAAQLSEHGKADAIDVRDFQLADGRQFGLTDVTVDRDWRETIRASACARFSTVLGPGSDGYHEEHIHLDLAERRNNYKVCQWDVRVPPPVEAKAQPQTDQDKAPSAAADGEPQESNVAAIPIEQVPLPRPRPEAQIDRAPPRAHRSSLDGPLGIAA